MPSRAKANAGVTLVEVMIALVVLLLVMMGLLQAALLSIDNNMRNILRDEGVNMATAGSAELRNVAFTNAALTATGAGYGAFPLITRKDGTTIDPGGDVTRDFRNFTRTFVRMVRIQNLDASTKSVQVVVGWNHRDENNPEPGRPPLAPTGKEFQHSVTAIRRNQ